MYTSSDNGTSIINENDAYDGDDDNAKFLVEDEDVSTVKGNPIIIQ